MIAFWKNKIKDGSSSNHVSAFQDIMPTLAEVAGVSIPAQTNGLSFLPTLLNQDQKKHEFLNWEIQLSGWFQTLPDGGFRQSCRIGDWKGVRYGINSKMELYNLDDDISESNNIALKYPELVNRMLTIFETNRTEISGFPYGGVVQNYKSQDKFLLE
jgi:arylsulfatase A-like enzyme